MKTGLVRGGNKKTKDRESRKRIALFLLVAVLFLVSLVMSGCFGERVSEQNHLDSQALAPGASFSKASFLRYRLLSRRPIVDRTGTILCISRRDEGNRIVRIQPYKGIFSDIIGYVDRYGRGLDGIEYAYDTVLLSERAKKDSNHPLILSLDKNLQALCKKNLEYQIRRLRSKAGALILMDVKSGQILAMVSGRNGAPENGAGFNQKNLAIQGLANPWPVMLALTEAKAIDHRLKMDEKDSISCEAATSKGKDSLSDQPVVKLGHWHWHNFGQDAGFWTRLDQEELDNTALGPALLPSLINIGLGQETGIDLPGERQGRLPSVLSSNVTDVIASTASATPLQILCAYTSIIKNGSVVRPRLLLKDQTVTKKASARPAKPLLTPEAHLFFLKAFGDNSGPSIATYSPESGTGKRGYQVVGLGFWPADNPKISYISVLFQARYTPVQRRGTLGKMALLAKKGSYALKEQFRFAQKADGAGKVVLGQDSHRIMPDLRGMSIRSALETVGRLGLRVRFSGTGKVRQQYPRPGRRISRKIQCVLVCSNG